MQTENQNRSQEPPQTRKLVGVDVPRLVSLFNFMQNTSNEQDREIKAAQSSDHILNLIAIIEDLDAQLTEWKAAADAGSGCDTPEGLRDFINSIG